MRATPTLPWRTVWVLVHRWVGLVLALFLVLAGLTGSVLVWYHELDHWVNRSWAQVHEPGQPQPAADVWAIRDAVARQHPDAWVSYVELARAPGEPLRFYLQPRPGVDDSALAADEVFVHPYTGQVLAQRRWGDLSQGWINLMPFIYRLHYQLALGTVGTWIFGIVALLWTLDCFVGAWLTVPARQRRAQGGGAGSWWRRWQPAWTVRWGAGGTKINFDLHRAGGLWLWALLFVLAWSSVAFNLQSVYRPVMELAFDFHDPREQQPVLPVPRETPALGFAAALARGQVLAAEAGRAQGFTAMNAESISYDARKGVYRYRFRSSDDIRDRSGVTSVYLDGDSGALQGVYRPTGGAAGETVTQWLYSLHMAAVFGLPFRLFISVAGVLVAGLSVTGVLIWWRKRRGRLHHQQRTAVPARPLGPPLRTDS